MDTPKVFDCESAASEKRETAIRALGTLYDQKTKAGVWGTAVVRMEFKAGKMHRLVIHDETSLQFE